MEIFGSSKNDVVKQMSLHDFCRKKVIKIGVTQRQEQIFL